MRLCLDEEKTTNRSVVDADFVFRVIILGWVSLVLARIYQDPGQTEMNGHTSVKLAKTASANAFVAISSMRDELLVKSGSPILVLFRYSIKLMVEMDAKLAAQRNQLYLND